LHFLHLDQLLFSADLNAKSLHSSSHYFPPVSKDLGTATPIVPTSKVLEQATNTERRSVLENFRDVVRSVRFGKQPVSKTVRPIKDEEESTLSTFESHATSCPFCSDPGIRYVNDEELCQTGYELAQNVLLYLHMRDDGELYSSTDEEGSLVVVQISRDPDYPISKEDAYPLTMEMLRLTHMSYRDDKRNRAFISVNQTWEERTPARNPTVEIRSATKSEQESKEQPPPGVNIYEAEVTVPASVEPGAKQEDELDQEKPVDDKPELQRSPTVPLFEKKVTISAKVSDWYGSRESHAVGNSNQEEEYHITLTPGMMRFWSARADSSRGEWNMALAHDTVIRKFGSLNFIGIRPSISLKGYQIRCLTSTEFDELCDAMRRFRTPPPEEEEDQEDRVETTFAVMQRTNWVHYRMIFTPGYLRISKFTAATASTGEATDEDTHTLPHDVRASISITRHTFSVRIEYPIKVLTFQLRSLSECKRLHMLIRSFKDKNPDSESQPPHENTPQKIHSSRPGSVWYTKSLLDPELALGEDCDIQVLPDRIQALSRRQFNESGTQPAVMVAQSLRPTQFSGFRKEGSQRLRIYAPSIQGVATYEVEQVAEYRFSSAEDCDEVYRVIKETGGKVKEFDKYWDGIVGTE